MYLFEAIKKLFPIHAITIAVIAMTALPAHAFHQWSNYKWDRAPLILTIVDNTYSTSNSLWPSHLANANDDWDNGATEDGTTLNTGSFEDVVTINPDYDNNTLCDPVGGNVQVCNGDYGSNGWLGIAQIWLSRGKNKYIIAGVAKVNDHYFDQSTYNSPAWRQLVMCQEVAHTFGLDHQDENFGNANLGTCMDYTSTPAGNEHPNAHDYEELASMYTASTDEEPGDETCNPRSPKCLGADVPLENPGDWGRRVSGRGGVEVYEKDLPNGYRVVTHVTWTIEHTRDQGHHRH